MMISRIFPSLIFIQCNSQIKSFIVIFLDCLLISFTHNKNIFSLAIFSSFSIVRTVTAQFVPFLSLSLSNNIENIYMFLFLHWGREKCENEWRSCGKNDENDPRATAGWLVDIYSNRNFSFFWPIEMYVCEVNDIDRYRETFTRTTESFLSTNGSLDRTQEEKEEEKKRPRKIEKKIICLNHWPEQSFLLNSSLFQVLTICLSSFSQAFMTW